LGTNFRGPHLLLDEIVNIAGEASDTAAERLRTLNGTAPPPTCCTLLSTI
jgi:DNA-binding ferritin-like protein